ncbi:uncharacterized protein B0H18DRAFT_1008846 [Fomitopsis serialis]|uniref:uncharacterized protein n=1 Tax=Fomitopsis serialis TaxID=139415 RepID=UPI002008DACC|nr:uncharacterized protein B0H18DRAFT_1008846 [Neoantrodia serialis]KAH9925530.1 hypothetical protein B0H18DRAFT_1008846 [Neoantrodia serialis]
MSDSLAAHQLRITNHGKINAWVQFALRFLQENPDQPLVFHTLPAKGKQVHHAQDDVSIAPAEAQPSGSGAVASKKPRNHTSMSTIPRLVSVVEIVKREYLKTLDPALSQAGKLSGLHQYNHVGELEQDEPEASLSPEEERQQAITQALSGKRHLRQHKVAYMKVTLCRKQLPDLVEGGATYQQPEIRALSKSARTRLKKKLKKPEATT